MAADHGALHILVNCQGTTEIKPAIELTETEYDTILDTNLKSVFFACTAFGRGMIARGQGAIINISSLAAHTGWANAAAYCASKWGVAGITQSLAAEWGESGVRVNAIAPGFFMTELNQARMSDERKAEARRRSAMKRMGELHELVGAAMFPGVRRRPLCHGLDPSRRWRVSILRNLRQATTDVRTIGRREQTSPREGNGNDQHGGATLEAGEPAAATRHRAATLSTGRRDSLQSDREWAAARRRHGCRN